MTSHVEKVLNLYENNLDDVRRAIHEVGGNPDAVLDFGAKKLIKQLSMNGVYVECRLLENWDENL